MNFQFYLEKLSNSNNFKQFLKERPNAYLCSGFFSIDKEPKNTKEPDNKTHIDFYDPDKKEAFSFELNSDSEIKQVKLENFNKNPENISEDTNFSFDEIEEIIKKEMEKNEVTSKIQKIILSLQNANGKDAINAIIFVSMLGIVKMNIDLTANKVSGFEKKSFFDMMKVVKKPKDKTKNKD